MDILSAAIIVFAVIETLNIGILYFRPGTRMGNGMGVFKAYRTSEADAETRELVRYLVNWVAGTKLIFVGLLAVIVLTGSQTTKAFAVMALILSILSFFWRLFPAIVRLDRDGQITPNGYSRTLGIMIACFVGGGWPRRWSCSSRSVPAADEASASRNPMRSAALLPELATFAPRRERSSRLA